MQDAIRVRIKGLHCAIHPLIGAPGKAVRSTHVIYSGRRGLAPPVVVARRADRLTSVLLVALMGPWEWGSPRGSPS